LGPGFLDRSLANKINPTIATIMNNIRLKMGELPAALTVKMINNISAIAANSPCV
jgi:hypothetical protein